MKPLEAHETVLAIDPGNAESAYCVLGGDRTIKEFGKLPNEEFKRQVLGLVKCSTISLVACETVASYGMSVGASVFDTCVFIGELKQLLSCACPWVQVVRLEVKLAICKNVTAKDANIRAALMDLYGAPGTKANPGKTYGMKADMWAALALAETVRSGQFRPYVPYAERKDT